MHGVVFIVSVLPFRFSLWFLHPRSVPGHHTVTHPCVASRRFHRLRRPLTTTSLRCLPLPRPTAPACTPTQPPPPSPQRRRPWSSCSAVVTTATDTLLLPMQQHTPQPPLLEETRPVARILSVVCCTASPQPTSTNLPLVLPMLV